MKLEAEEIKPEFNQDIKMLSTLDNEEISVMDKADEERNAAVQAKPFRWNDIILHPFAIDREMDMLLWRTDMNRPPLYKVSSVAQGEMIPLTFLADATAILWFCAVHQSEWLLCNALEVDAKIRAWSNQNIKPGDQVAVILLASEIFQRAHSTQVDIKSDGVSTAKK